MEFFNQLREATKGLHWTEKAGLLNLALMLSAIPVEPGVSLVFFCFWVLSVILKNTLLKRWSFFAWHQDKTYATTKCGGLMLPMFFYWASYFLSLLWTENLALGWANVGALTWLAVFVLTYNCTDFREVRKIHLRGIFWLYVMCLLVLFGVLWVKGSVSTGHANIYRISQVFNDYMHHSYMAVYLLIGLAFLYTEVDGLESGGKHNCKYILIGLCTCILLLFLLMINARTGILGLLLLLAMCWLHQTFVRKHRRLAIVTLVMAPLLLLVLHWSLPDGFQRMSATFQEASQGKEDDRIAHIKQVMPVIKENIVFGVGAGDQKAALAPQWGYTIEEQDMVSNTHNQYLDTWMATGLLGLAALLAMMIVPICYAWRRKNFLMFCFISIFAVSILFESMLERQMGVVFYCVMLLLFAIEAEIESLNSPSLHL